MAFNPHSFKLF